MTGKQRPRLCGADSNRECGLCSSELAVDGERGPPGELKLLARTNAFAPGIHGEPTEARWDRLVSHALPAGPEGGPVLVARVRGKGVTLRNNTGVWAMDSNGVLRQLLRTGDLASGEPIVGI